EEFALILPETDEEAAIKVAERCRKLILDQDIPHEKSEAATQLTASLGVVTVIPADDDDPIAFIEQADKRLYAAKQEGRNRIEHA
ncbi:diguanylate cyclase domain-containing protein, partial [Acidihalobacter prosperus]